MTGHEDTPEQDGFTVQVGVYSDGEPAFIQMPDHGHRRIRSRADEELTLQVLLDQNRGDQ